MSENKLVHAHQFNYISKTTTKIDDSEELEERDIEIMRGIKSTKIVDKLEGLVNGSLKRQ